MHWRLNNTNMAETSMNTNKEKFCNELGSFVSQTITSTIMAYVKCVGIPQPTTPPENIINILSYFNKVYLDSCWHLYGKKEDTFIVESFDKILSYQLIKGITCLIHWIDFMCEAVFILKITHQIMLELKTMVDDDNKRKYISNVMEKVMKTVLEKNYETIKCEYSDACQAKYNGSDFFEFVESDMTNDVDDTNADKGYVEDTDDFQCDDATQK